MVSRAMGPEGRALFCLVSGERVATVVAEARSEERGDKFVEERAGDAVVVGDEKIHGAEETTKITKDTKKEFAQSGRIG